MAKHPSAIDVVNNEVAEPLTKHDRATLADLLDEYRQRFIGRRRFLAGASAFGLSTLSISTLLDACAPAKSSPASQADHLLKLNVAIDGDTTSLDPQAGKNVPGYQYCSELYAPLIDLQSIRAGDAQQATNENVEIPSMAQSIAIPPDLQTVTITLNKQAKWRDGSPVTVEDMAYAFRRDIENPSSGNEGNFLAGLLALTKGSNVQTPDPQTLVLKLDKPDPMIRELLWLQHFGPLNSRVAAEHATPSDPWANSFWGSHVFESGPYLLKNRVPGTSWAMVPNRHFWNGSLPKNGGLDFTIITDPSERYSLLTSGTAHVATELSPDKAAALRRGASSAAKLVSGPSTRMRGLGFNTSRPPTNNKRVRQALSYAVPYQTIIDDAMYGLARPAKSIIPSGMPTSDQSFWNYDTDLRTAKQILDAAGYPNGFDTNIIVPLGTPEDLTAATFIQSNFRQIGVNATINQLESSAYYAAQTKADFAMMILEEFSWVNDPFYQLTFTMLSKNTTADVTRYSNPQVDQIITTGAYTTDQAQRDALSRQAQQIIAEDAPWAFLYVRDWYLGVASNLHDVPHWPDEEPRLYHSYLS